MAEVTGASSDEVMQLNHAIQQHATSGDTKGDISLVLRNTNNNSGLDLFKQTFRS